MDIKRISPLLSVSAQIQATDMQHLADQGFRTIINNRPDHEIDEQPLAADLAAEAARHGMTFVDVPVRSGAITEQNATDFSAQLNTAEGPILAFCRTGTRSTTLWALHEARHMQADAIIDFAASIGYDLSAQKDRLQQLGAQAGERD